MQTHGRAPGKARSARQGSGMPVVALRGPARQGMKSTSRSRGLSRPGLARRGVARPRRVAPLTQTQRSAYRFSHYARARTRDGRNVKVAVYKASGKLPPRVKILTDEQWALISKQRGAKGKHSVGTAIAKRGILFAVTNPDDSMSAVDLGIKALHTITHII